MKSEKTDYKAQIVDFLKNNPSGQTISDIAKGIGASRMTVSKYVSILEATEKIVPKKIGAYTIYFSSHPVYVPKRIIMLFYLGLIQGINDKEVKDKKNYYKGLGYRISENLDVLFNQKLSVPEDVDDYTKLIKNLARIYPQIDVLNDIKVNIETEIMDKGKKSIFHFKDIALFNESEDFLYHFYITAGVIEKIMSRLIYRKVAVEIKYYDYSKKEVDMLIEIF